MVGKDNLKNMLSNLNIWTLKFMQQQPAKNYKDYHALSY